MIKKSALVLLIMCLILFFSACSRLQDNFKGTTVYYYVQNITSIDLYYKLEGASQNIISSGLVNVQDKVQIAWTKQFEVAGHPFITIKIYDGNSSLLFENDIYNEFDMWKVESLGQNIQAKTLVLDDEKLSIISEPSNL